MSRNYLSCENIRTCLKSAKVRIIAILTSLLLVTAVLLNVFGIWDRLFSSGDIIFYTTYVFPNIEDQAYPFCILSAKDIIPIANSVAEEKTPEEISGPPNNITFTITNSTKDEYLIEKIEAILIDYKQIPEKCIYTTGAFAMLQSIDLYLELSPQQKTYDLSQGKYISISSGKTEHVFQVWVSGVESGIYNFDIRVTGRVAGKKSKIIESDINYTFAVVDPEKCNVAIFLYEGAETDPNFQELLNVANKPVSEFKKITADWGEYELLDCIHNAPAGLLRFIQIGLATPVRKIDILKPSNLVTKNASELVLSTDDIRSVLGRLRNVDGTPVKLDVLSDELPGYILDINTQSSTDNVLSAKSVKYSILSPFIEVLYNTVAVYPSVEDAKEAYLRTLIPLESERLLYKRDIEIGDEYYCRIGESVRDLLRILVFRKNNVVVAIVGIPDLAFIEQYASLIKEKI